MPCRLAPADEPCCGRRPSRLTPARRHWRRSSRSPCARVWPWRCRSDFRSRRRSRSPVPAGRSCNFAIVARISGFSTSCSGGMPAEVFFSFCSPSLATRQSATAAAKIAISTGSAASTRWQHFARGFHMRHRDAGGIVEIDRTRDQDDISAGGLRGRGNGETLLAGGAVGDVAHRIDRLVGRACGDEDALAGQRPWLRRTQKRARRRRRFPEAPPSGRRRPHRLPPFRRHWARPWRRHRARAARHCGGSRHCSTSAGSSPAPAGSAGWPRAGWRWRDRRHDPAPSSPSGPRSQAPPRSGRSRGRDGYGRHRTRSPDRTGRCNSARSTARWRQAA